MSKGEREAMLAAMIGHFKSVIEASAGKPFVETDVHLPTKSFEGYVDAILAARPASPLRVQETCIECGKCDPCDDDCPNYQDQEPAARPASNEVRDQAEMTFLDAAGNQHRLVYDICEERPGLGSGWFLHEDDPWAALAAEPGSNEVRSLNFFSENVDAWGAVEWFNRLARAIRQHDEAVRANDDVTMEICRNVAASSAMRLVRDYEQQVRAALAAEPGSNEVRVGFRREWLQGICDQMFAMTLPSGHVGDWLFLFREMIKDALAAEPGEGDTIPPKWLMMQKPDAEPGESKGDASPSPKSADCAGGMNGSR